MNIGKLSVENPVLMNILVVLLLVFGARRLPELGGALGKGIREFKRSVHDIEGELTRSDPPREVPRSEQRPAVSAGGDSQTTEKPAAEKDSD